MVFYNNAAYYEFFLDVNVVMVSVTPMDEHGYRREYCNRVYQAAKRPVKALKDSDRYYCRGDMNGTVYDRRALLIASEALGHSRISVIPVNYAPDP